jgi:hypothetical protein
MHPKSTRTFASHLALTTALAAGLTLAPLGEATAQHSGHPSHGAKKRAPRAASPAAPGAVEYQAAHHKMMQSMDLPYTGDPDVDFRVHMIPHHQGAIDMARVALRRANDPWTRQMAEGVIVEQQREIAEMQQWLARRGISPPPGGQPRHIMRANSYRSIPEEPGTRAELRGQSWAPGLGVPAAR